MKKPHGVQTFAHSHKSNQSSQNRKAPDLQTTPPLTPSPSPPPPRGVKALNGLGTFSISTEASRPAQINRRTPPKKVTFSATLECNYHVLNSLTPPHLHPPLFFLFSEGFFFLLFRAKITLDSPKEGERQSFLFHFFFLPPQPLPPPLPPTQTLFHLNAEPRQIRSGWLLGLM